MIMGIVLLALFLAYMKNRNKQTKPGENSTFQVNFHHGSQSDWLKCALKAIDRGQGAIEWTGFFGSESIESHSGSSQQMYVKSISPFNTVRAQFNPSHSKIRLFDKVSTTSLSLLFIHFLFCLLTFSFVHSLSLVSIHFHFRFAMHYVAGNCYDKQQYGSYFLYCPYAYRLPNGSILAKDLAAE